MIRRLAGAALLWMLAAPAAAQGDLRLAGDLCFPTRAGQVLGNVGAIGSPRDARARVWQRTLGDQIRVPRGPLITLAGWTWPGNAVALAVLRHDARGVRVLGVWEDCFGPLGCDMAITDQQTGPPTMIVVESRCTAPLDDPRATSRPRTEVRRHVAALGIRRDRVWLAGQVELEQHPDARVRLDDGGRTLVVDLGGEETRIPLDPSPGPGGR